MRAISISVLSKLRIINNCNRCYRSSMIMIVNTQSQNHTTGGTDGKCDVDTFSSFMACKKSKSHILSHKVPLKQNIRKYSAQKTLGQSECFNSEKIDTLSEKYHHCWVRLFQSTTSCLSERGDSKPSEISEAEYETYVEETLDSLTDFFEDLPESGSCKKDYDCSYGSGVLTIHIGDLEGTYVINKQTPNKQIWLSSPVSGPKRYDYLDGQWIYLRDGKGLHRVLEEEISKLIGIKIDLKKCSYYS